MSDNARPRSRFDQSEAERPPRSRFDRRERSRSPVSREPDSRRTRERSPVAREGTDSPAASEASKAKVENAAAKAAAAAAKIAASIMAKKGIQHVDVPPIRAAPSPPAVRSPAVSAERQTANGEIFQQDGDYIKDIEINDLKNRYTLTKGAVQKRIKDETGADVTTRGEYYPDKAMATAASPPLYLRVTSTSKEGLEAAIQQIQDLMNQELPDLVDQRRFRRREPEQFERDEYGRRKWPEEKLAVDLEPISGFNLRAQVVGRSGDNVKYIQQQTGCKVQIKGRGSGFLEQATGAELDEPMFLHIAGPRPEGVEKAKELSEQLLETVRNDYHKHKENASQGRFGGDSYGRGRPGYGDRGDRDRGQSYGYGGGYGGHNGSSDVHSPVGGSSQAADYNAQWAAYYASQGQSGQSGEDPYAAYGGYEAYMQMYYAYYNQQQQQAPAGTQQSPPPGTVAAPPPGEPGPPGPPGAVPPPPSGSPPPGFGSVPPPPGM